MHTLIRLLERGFEGERERVLERGERGQLPEVWPVGRGERSMWGSEGAGGAAA